MYWTPLFENDVPVALSRSNGEITIIGASLR